MIPIRDENPTLRTPVVTIILIAINALVWIVIQGAGTEPSLGASVCAFGVVPGNVTQSLPPDAAIRLTETTVCEVGGPPLYFTALTSMFMHGSWFHVIGNMWFLWIFGNNVEDSMGRIRFVFFYLLSGLAAAAAQTFVNPESAIPMVGASGAIGGVMGAYVVLYPRVAVHMLVFLGFFITTVRIPAMLMLGYWVLLQFVGGLPQLGGDAGGVAFWAHIGGFAAGVALIWLFKDAALVEAHRRIIGGDIQYGRVRR